MGKTHIQFPELWLIILTILIILIIFMVERVVKRLLGCQPILGNTSMDSSPSSATFLLPASLPKWPKGVFFQSVNLFIFLFYNLFWRCLLKLSRYFEECGNGFWVMCSYVVDFVPMNMWVAVVKCEISSFVLVYANFYMEKLHMWGRISFKWSVLDLHIIVVGG